MLLFNQAQNIPGLTKIKGFELLYQQRLDFLLNGSRRELQLQRCWTRATAWSPDLAEDNYNAVVYYETPRFATRLSYNFRGDYIECYGQLRLDFAGSTIATRSRLSRLQLQRQVSKPGARS